MSTTAPSNPTPAAPRPWRRPAIIALAIAGILLAVLIVAVVILLTLDWNRAKPWLSARAGEAIARPVAIDGDLSVQWRRVDADQSWHRFIPWPHIVLNGIRIGDPAGFPATGPLHDTAQVAQLRFAVNPWQLLKHTIDIPSLELSQPQLRLVRTAEGRVNWLLPDRAGPSAWNVTLKQIVLAKGRVQYIDAMLHADLTADVDTIAAGAAPATAKNAAAGGAATTGAPAAYGIKWLLHGTMNKEAVTGDGMAGAILSLQTETVPFPVKATIAAGKTRIAAEGVLTRPRALTALDLNLKVSGISMAKLYALTGIVLPETPPYVTEGRLLTTFGKHDSEWRYEKFTGKFGGSDLGGTLVYHAALPRSKISGSLVSDTLVFADLAPIIGADSNASKRQRDASVLQPADKLLPVEPFNAGRWNVMDADVDFSANHIVRGKALPLDKLSAKVHLDNGVLSLLPLDFSFAGGTLHSTIMLDGRTAPIKGDIKLTARDMQLKKLFPAFQPMQASLGQLNGAADLRLRGNSIASLLGASNGTLRADIGAGTISKLLLEEIGLNVGNIVLTKVVGDKQVKLHCAASDFTVTNGLMQVRNFVVETDEATIRLTGGISLAQERLDLTISPGTKAARVFTLRTPLYVRGTFKDPDVKVDTGLLALKAGSALALAAVAPVAAVIPLINTGQQRPHSPCTPAPVAAAKPAPDSAARPQQQPKTRPAPAR